MNLIERVQAILLRPRQTWPAIAAEPTEVATIYSRYLVILAAIPALASFVGWTLVGGGMMGVTFRLPIATGLIEGVVNFVLALGLVYVLALVVNALATAFGGSKDLLAAFKLAAYSSTAGFVGGIFNLVPALAWLGFLAAFYSLYLLYTGVPVLMRCAPEKAAAYTAVTAVCMIVVAIVVTSVSSLLLGPGPMHFGSHTVGGPTHPGAGGEVQIKTPDGATVTINPSAMADMAKRMDITGSGNAAPIAAADLKSMLPESLGDMKRTAIEAQSSEAMGIAATSAKASYAAGDKQAELSISDTGSLAALAAMAGWANVTMDKETDGKVEKVYKEGSRTVHEEYRKDGSHAEMAVILANGVVVAAEGSRMDIATLKDMVRALDVAKIEATKRVAKR